MDAKYAKSELPRSLRFRLAHREIQIAIWLVSLVDGTPVFKMASLIDNYEQQYAVLTADITAKIGRIRSQSGGK